MTFLPIVERELRVAARRRSTFWLRVSAAGVALVIGAGMLLLSLVPFVGQAASGGAFFATLSWMSFMVALSGGLFLTCDCLSEEKRDGTLGFLFLTDLRGYDVVLGKVLATSLRSVSPLLAVFPVLALTQLLGGVEGSQFWRTVFAIGNAAFFSLTAGVLISALSWHATRALAGTLLVLALFVGLGPIVDNLGLFVNGRFVPVVSLASPGFAFVAADDGRHFWSALLVNQLVAWGLLGLACFLVRRTWQDKPRRHQASPGVTPAVPVAAAARERRSALLDRNPLVWLVTRERGSALLWLLALVAVASAVVLSAVGWLQVWSGLGGVISLGLYLWVAARASHFFTEARRNGTVELLLSTPLSAQDTIVGVWQGLLKIFGLPVVLLVAANWFALMSGALMGEGFLGDEMVWLQVVSAIAGSILVALNLVALAWFGLWMGLTSKNTLLATLKTIAFVQIIPWFAIYMITMLSLPVVIFYGVPSSGPQNSTQNTMVNLLPFLFLILPILLGIVKAVFFWQLARRRLITQYRRLAAQAVVPVLPAVVPPRIPPQLPPGS